MFRRRREEIASKFAEWRESQSAPTPRASTLSIMNVHVTRIGGIWHGTIEGHPEVDIRALTEEVAQRKVEAVAAQLRAARVDAPTPAPERKE
jgi:hypothetical protein